MTRERQLGLFDPPPVKPRTFDEARLIARLREVNSPHNPPSPGLSRAAIKRLMTPLPPITVPR
jgi:hypothetical protein